MSTVHEDLIKMLASSWCSHCLSPVYVILLVNYSYHAMTLRFCFELCNSLYNYSNATSSSGVIQTQLHKNSSIGLYILAL